MQVLCDTPAFNVSPEGLMLVLIRLVLSHRHSFSVAYTGWHGGAKLVQSLAFRQGYFRLRVRQQGSQSA